MLHCYSCVSYKSPTPSFLQDTTQVPWTSAGASSDVEGLDDERVGLAIFVFVAMVYS